MSKKLDLVELLRDCPRGTKLYSTIHGEVDFYSIVYTNDKCLSSHPIAYTCTLTDGYTRVVELTADGRYTAKANGECVLFPSKDQRDWSKFKSEVEMIDGEVYFCGRFNKVNDSIYIYRSSCSKTEFYVLLDVYNLTLCEKGIITYNEKDLKELRKATEEEKQLLNAIIKRDGYVWDSVKKELVKSESKFDISTIQPFDKVLVRSSNDTKWRCDLFSFISTEYFKFTCVSYAYCQCVPYNSETKHLVGTTKLPPEKYINW